jgi:hypothetical protein
MITSVCLSVLSVPCMAAAARTLEGSSLTHQDNAWPAHCPFRPPRHMGSYEEGQRFADPSRGCETVYRLTDASLGFQRDAVSYRLGIPSQRPGSGKAALSIRF